MSGGDEQAVHAVKYELLPPRRKERKELWVLTDFSSLICVRGVFAVKR
jgi:hypothetical protein